jgi:hypothetical protein
MCCTKWSSGINSIYSGQLFSYVFPTVLWFSLNNEKLASWNCNLFLKDIHPSYYIQFKVGDCDKFYFTFKLKVWMWVWIYQIFQRDWIPICHLSN